VRYHDLPITPQFAFGHGLSYSEFSQRSSQASVGPGERIDISITVEHRVIWPATKSCGSTCAIRSQASPASARLRSSAHRSGRRRAQAGHVQPHAEQFAFWNPRGQWLIEAGRIDF
jgi:hypothetical protein